MIDPAGNWVRVSQRPDVGQEPRVVDDRTGWVSAGGGRLAIALENAVVMADSHGDVPQALRVLGGAVDKHDGTPPEKARALAYLVELQIRADEPAHARGTLDRLTALQADTTIDADDLIAVRAALDEAEEAMRDTTGPGRNRRVRGNPASSG
ncbi:tetratricopeptide repeat protein [Ornithinimicrobium cerasi]|uniref:tetratricopeptide repeat protein n=1 Tax=Ornithinimicrobium cerasi TaxID=2248773 RepID=UPI000EFEA439|nr:tetratricopeptide repeat protein [Ornithinimicrobium cerasi]